MAVRFDTEGERLTTNASGWNYNAAYTIMAWVYIAVDRNDWSYLMGSCRSGAPDSDHDTIEMGSTGTNLEVECGYSAQTGSTLSTGTWYHLTIVRSSVTQLLGYYGTLTALPALDITLNHSTVASRSAADTFGLNPFIYSGQWLNGRVAYMKAWTTNLSLAEIQQEAMIGRPVKTANLYGYWPILPNTTIRAYDLSGNGRNFTEAGTLTDEDHPPISWGAGARFFPFTAASGTTYNQSATGTLTSAAALIRQGQLVKAGTLTSAGAIIRQTQAIKAGAITSAGATNKRTAKAYSGSAASAGAIVRQPGKVATGTLTSAGAIVRQAGKVAAGTVTTAGAIVRQTRKAAAGAVTSAGALSAVRTILQSLTGAITSAGAVVRQTRKAAAGTVTSAGSAARQLARSLAGTVTSAGAVSAIKTALKTLTGTLTSAGALARQTGKPLTGAATSAGALSKRTARALAGSVTSAGAAVKQAGKVAAGTIALSAVVARSTAKTLSAALTSAGSLLKSTLKTLTGTLTSSGAESGSTGGGTVNLTGVIALAGALVKQVNHVIRDTEGFKWFYRRYVLRRRE